MSGVTHVFLTGHEPDCEDMSVCDALREIQPHVFANGGDRFADNIPEAVLARELGIETLFNIGYGGKVQSSSWLTADDRDQRDCFCGTGTTMVAAHQLNRRCYGMELDPKYCQVIIDRMKKLDPNLSVKINGKDYVKTTI